MAEVAFAVPVSLAVSAALGTLVALRMNVLGRTPLSS
jgi:hypothetical protein